MLLNYRDFDMVYDDWTTMEDISIRQSHVAEGIAECIKLKYPDDSINDRDLEEDVEYLYDKAFGVNQKLAMMMYAQSKLEEAIKDFEGTQNMNCTALYGMGHTVMLFYFESMIVFARNALDIAATIYSELLFMRRSDSFNDLSKRIMKSSDNRLCVSHEYFITHSEEGLSAFRLLCGSVKGRALRDIIIHQANAQLTYQEYKKDSEKERLFLHIKDNGLIDVKSFMVEFTKEVEDMILMLNADVRKYLTAI